MTQKSLLVMPTLLLLVNGDLKKLVCGCDFELISCNMHIRNSTGHFLSLQNLAESNFLGRPKAYLGRIAGSNIDLQPIWRPPLVHQLFPGCREQSDFLGCDLDHLISHSIATVQALQQNFAAQGTFYQNHPKKSQRKASKHLLVNTSNLSQ